MMYKLAVLVAVAADVVAVVVDVVAPQPRPDDLEVWPRFIFLNRCEFFLLNFKVVTF